jgi:hypothetical protein
MTALPLTENSYKYLHDMVTAPIRSKLLMAGIELGVFDELEASRSAQEIAATMEMHPGNTEMFLNALVTIGLVEKKSGLYRNRQETSVYLVRQSPTYIGSLFNLVQRMCVDSLEGLASLVKSGPRPESQNGDAASDARWAEAARASAGGLTG